MMESKIIQSDHVGYVLSLEMLDLSIDEKFNEVHHLTRPTTFLDKIGLVFKASNKLRKN